MAQRLLSICVPVALFFVFGCPVVPVTPPPEAVLEGQWDIIPAEPGEFALWSFVAVFNADGQLQSIEGTRPDGATASLAATGSTTELDGNAVTVSIPQGNVTKVFEGTLSADANTITGSITDEIDLGDLEASLPAGDLTLERVVEEVDPCQGVQCDEGETCVDGQCVADDPCADVTCDEGETCVDGQCVADVTGPDPAAGEAFYAANNCAVCHGADATGPPSLVGVNADTHFDKLSGNVSHAGGTVDGVTEDDAANVEAWIASLQ